MDIYLDTKKTYVFKMSSSKFIKIRCFLVTAYNQEDAVEIFNQKKEEILSSKDAWEWGDPEVSILQIDGVYNLKPEDTLW